jgi:putative restriction endonuclease
MDSAIRIAAFDWLKDQAAIYDDVLPRTIIETGFHYKNNRISLVGPKGIWKPQYCVLPISITSITDGPYDDSLTKDNFLYYKYRGTNPYHSDNIGLRELFLKKIPLIYFHGIVRGKYVAVWPIYIIGDDIRNLTFKVALDQTTVAVESMVNEDAATYYRRAYLTSEVKIRLHQRSFRERVLMAYRNQCTFCRLKHSELLDAAHIISDKSIGGDPIIQNGLSLCKIHHAAFDKNILGLTPDYKIKVRVDILHETDGPMLKYGLQSLHNKIIELPKRHIDYPDKDRLEIRYHLFKSA